MEATDRKMRNDIKTHDDTVNRTNRFAVFRRRHGNFARMKAPLTLLHRIKIVWRQSEGKELEQGFVRLLIGAAAVLYISWFAPADVLPRDWLAWRFVAMAFLVFSLINVCLIFARPSRSVPRR